MKPWKAYLIMMISLPVFWVIVIGLFHPPSFLLPPPKLVIRVLAEDKGVFWHHTKITLIGALTGYAVSNFIAVGLSIAFIYVNWLEDFFTPWTVVIKNVPFVAIASILVITLGDTPLPRIIIVVLVTFFPILANVTKGLKSVDQVLLDRMQTLNASKWQVFWKVRWSSAMPYYIAAHEIAFTGSIIGAIVAEWLFAREGLGFLIVRSMSQYRTDMLFAVTLIASALSVCAYLSVKLIEKRIYRWRKEISS
ncbi:MAG: ABC-type nitrate/sulfonate/bicarbonate transport system, permease component [Candidatus Woesebacteria bacterium GW2011_GWB1_43_14]|uniref:ABC-type nitrate/sulfonate/bicarbonate transport system, permease component n=1 Tax=Candidatus Woesebacteria bacterium GW2011_GWB1_43_14 TaxID=1618578 RepID=A0A0G1GEN5_9BACT|nr:MAG: ABC-type nitrate/sulfonate/bicarbonate transport system, permease component [Candidatus Woesebacteria bacterium GW2011_GWA1_39_11b]KKS77493.1 MAG: ABC-type nitrate/sulfonate/bicarbonate transport system, permease component [Candidatus Woesebacteria bacterium GW2011_GWC1_42_9]KKS97328.1 MAG: ABC-type nitrate/sulfonate/bicarbonate transport system, permease component [Candidatus Woesebacteria bacterium GW2011_GWB1_43_14]